MVDLVALAPEDIVEPSAVPRKRPRDTYVKREGANDDTSKIRNLN